jgi:hypothetical protein
LIQNKPFFLIITTKINNKKMLDMEQELNKFGPNSRTSKLNKLKQYKLDVEMIQKDLVISELIISQIR